MRRREAGVGAPSLSFPLSAPSRSPGTLSSLQGVYRTKQARTSRADSSWCCTTSFSASSVEARFHSASSFPRSSAAVTTAVFAASFDAATPASAADARLWT